ncbi:MAG: hypothetical protein WCX70_01270 [Candidatus Paceibacterota bacterium]|jgi:hypothetical protein
MSKTYKFLPEDFLVLLDKIIELEQKVIQFGYEMGESTRQSSETWHDNATYDVARFNFEMTTTELQKLVEIRNGAKIVKTKNKPSTKVRMGSVVKILNQSTGQTQLVKITGDTIH